MSASKAANVLGTIGTASSLVYLKYGPTGEQKDRGLTRLDDVSMGGLWAQILLYGSKWPKWKASLLAIGVAALFAGVEAALISTLRPIYDEGNETPVMVVGIVAAILLAAGLLPPYGELWKRRGRVVGINWVFLAMDWSGAFFSLMALGGVLYIIWKIRKAAAAEGKTFDDVAAEREANGIPFKFAERKGRSRGECSEAEEADGTSEVSASCGIIAPCMERGPIPPPNGPE
ncbi:uncharacterized protein B0T15DRAFT_507383 [Chaetomium strumarium]|uniref:Uncharacterized protein n=1 Tax=Chaetomium strumarium TaxID=1170767 RepID=A0AAJ0H2P5_9PEZI|nr:hypothetical protein B0T15DRAFT_507383 [Chaetomium strumarium]